MKNFSLLLLIGLLISSCSGITQEQLNGKWTAVQLTEEGDSLAVNLEEISLKFDAQNNYNFTSTLNYREEGTYKLNKNLLSTVDKLNPNTDEKLVEITKLAND